MGWYGVDHWNGHVTWIYIYIYTVISDTPNIMQYHSISFNIIQYHISHYIPITSPFDLWNHHVVPIQSLKWWRTSEKKDDISSKLWDDGRNGLQNRPFFLGITWNDRRKHHKNGRSIRNHWDNGTGKSDSVYELGNIVFIVFINWEIHS